MIVNVPRNKYKIAIILLLILMLSLGLLSLVKLNQIPSNINKSEIGNAFFYNEKDQKYYSDKKYKFQANDNTDYIIKKFNTEGKAYIPEGNYLCKRPLRIRGKNIELYGLEGKCKIIFDSKEKVFIEKGKQKSYIINDDYKLNYDANTAQNISIKGIDFEIKQRDENSYNYLLTLANIKGGTISNCRFISDVASKSMITFVNLLSCCKNIQIQNCYFKNMTNANTGGCIWVRNLTKQDSLKENITENIAISKCNFIQNSGDETVAVYSSVGNVKKVSVRDSSFEDYSDINAKVFSIFPSDNKDNGTVENIQFDNNKIYSEKIKYFVITVGGPNRSNSVSNVDISNNEITVDEDSDNKCTLIYVNDINTNCKDINVFNNTIEVNKLPNSTGIYNASLCKNNRLLGVLGRGIVFGECYQNIINFALRGIVFPEIAMQNEIYNSRIGISSKEQKSIICDNKIILSESNGLCGIEVQSSQKNYDITFTNNEIITNDQAQNGFVIHSGNIKLKDNKVSGPGRDIYKSDKAVIIK